MSRRTRQQWEFLRHPETGGEHWVPDNPGVVPMFKERGWQVADPGTAQRPDNRDINRWQAERDSRSAILTVTCGGGNRPHDPEVLLTAGRELWPGGAELYLHGAMWETVDGGDGFRYWPDFPARTSPQCPRCPAKPPILASKLRAELDNILGDSGGAPVRRRIDFRDLW